MKLRNKVAAIALSEVARAGRAGVLRPVRPAARHTSLLVDGHPQGLVIVSEGPDEDVWFHPCFAEEADEQVYRSQCALLGLEVREDRGNNNAPYDDYRRIKVRISAASLGDPLVEDCIRWGTREAMRQHPDL